MTQKSGKKGCFARVSKYRGILVLVVILGLVGWNGYGAIRHLVAEVHCNTVANSTLNRDQKPAIDEIKSAIFWDRNNAEYWHKLARALWDIRNAGEGLPGDEGRSEHQIEIVKALEQAVCLNPFQTQYRVFLGWAYSYLWQDSDHREDWLVAADTAMERVAYFAGEKDPGLYLTIGNYWIMRSKATIPSDPQWQTAWERASWHYRKAQRLERNKDLKHDIKNFVWRFYPDEEMIWGLLLS